MAHATGAPALLPFARCLCLARKSRLSKRATGHRRLRRQCTGHLWLQGASRAVPGVVRTPARAPARRGPLSLAAVPSIVVLRGPAGAHRVCDDSANRALLWRRKPLSQRQPTNPVHWVPSARIGQRPGSAPVSQHTPPRARGSAHTLSEETG